MSDRRSDRVAYADVDDIIAAAAKAKDERVESLSVEEMQEVAAELDIPPELVAPAIAEVRRRREQALAREHAAQQARAARNKILAGGALAGLAGLVVFAAVAHGALRESWLELERRRAQVVNVLERQRATVSQWEDAPQSIDKQAEISGAENRVRLERQRYDEAVTAYRREAGSLGGRMVRMLADYPADAPMSSEVDWW